MVAPDGSGPARSGDRLPQLAGLWCARLGLGSPTGARRLRAGRSGSTVLALRVDGQPLVVKATTEGGRLDRAALEARLLRTEGGPGGTAPELVASARGPGWVAVATRECAVLPQRLDHRTWIALAERLGCLHRPVHGGDDLLQEPAPDALPGDQAVGPWARLGAGDDAVLGARRLAAHPPDLPRVLEHGDCHLDNVLRDRSGTLVWVDWQEARAGDGLADLVFLWQRAEFAGARPPRQEMAETYARVRSLDGSHLQAVLDHTELRLLLHSWPPFLELGTPAARATLRRRLAALVRT